MKGKRLIVTVVAFLVSAMLIGSVNGWAETEKPTIIKPCKQCHKPEKGVLRGMLGSVSMKAETVKISIGPATWLVSFSDDTKLEGAEALDKIPRNKEIAVDVRPEGEDFYATRVRVKPPATVPAEKLIAVDEVSRFVEVGPEKGAFTLVDARPGKRYNEGHIPGAISIYDAQFDQNVSKLPADREMLLIFYCGGPS